MKILHQPRATVGQIVKDLEQIAAKSPRIFLEYIDDVSNDMFVEGIQLRPGIVILGTTIKSRRAATVEEFLAMFRMLDSSLGVVIRDSWQLLDFEPNEDGSIFWYDEEDDYCQFRLDRNVQLYTTQQIEQELEKSGLDKFLDCKVGVMMKKTRRGYHMNAVSWDYGKLCLCYCDDEDNQDITLKSFLEEFPVCAEFMVQLKGKYYTIEDGGQGLFFCYQKDGERYVSFYLGEVVYDPEEWD